MDYSKYQDKLTTRLYTVGARDNWLDLSLDAAKEAAIEVARDIRAKFDGEDDLSVLEEDIDILNERYFWDDLRGQKWQNQ